MNAKLFHFRQNNSGGSWHGPAVNVFVEAETLPQAIALSADHFTLCGDSGLYADYDSCGCCPCCGHRWTKPWDEEGEPMAEAIDIIKKDVVYMGAVNSALVKSDGSILIGKTAEDVAGIVSYLESK